MERAVAVVTPGGEVTEASGPQLQPKWSAIDPARDRSPRLSRMGASFVIAGPEWVSSEDDGDEVFAVVAPGTALEVVEQVDLEPGWVAVILPGLETPFGAFTTQFPASVGVHSGEQPSATPLSWISHAEAVARMRSLGASDLGGLEEMDPDRADTYDDDEFPTSLQDSAQWAAFVEQRAEQWTYLATAREGYLDELARLGPPRDPVVSARTPQEIAACAQILDEVVAHLRAARRPQAEPRQLPSAASAIARPFGQLLARALAGEPLFTRTVGPDGRPGAVLPVSETAESFQALDAALEIALDGLDFDGAFLTCRWWVLRLPVAAREEPEWLVSHAMGFSAPDRIEHVGGSFPYTRPAEFVVTELVAHVVAQVAEPLRIRSWAGPGTRPGILRAMASSLAVIDALGLDAARAIDLLDPNLGRADLIRLRQAWVGSWAQVTPDRAEQALHAIVAGFDDRYLAKRRRSRVPGFGETVRADDEMRFRLTMGSWLDMLERMDAPEADRERAAQAADRVWAQVPATLPTAVSPVLDAAHAYWAWYLNVLDEVTSPHRFHQAPADNPDIELGSQSPWRLRRHWPDCAQLPPPLQASLETLWDDGETAHRLAPDLFHQAIAMPLEVFQQAVATPFFTLHGPYAHPAIDDIADYIAQPLAFLREAGTPAPDALLGVLRATQELVPHWLSSSWEHGLVARRTVPGPQVARWGSALQRAGALDDQLTSMPDLAEALRLIAAAGSIQASEWVHHQGTAWLTALWRADAASSVQDYTTLRTRKPGVPTKTQARPALRAAARWLGDDTERAASVLSAEVK